MKYRITKPVRTRNRYVEPTPAEITGLAKFNNNQEVMLTATTEDGKKITLKFSPEDTKSAFWPQFVTWIKELG